MSAGTLNISDILLFSGTLHPEISFLSSFSCCQWIMWSDGNFHTHRCVSLSCIKAGSFRFCLIRLVSFALIRLFKHVYNTTEQITHRISPNPRQFVAWSSYQHIYSSISVFSLSWVFVRAFCFAKLSKSEKPSFRYGKWFIYTIKLNPFCFSVIL